MKVYLSAASDNPDRAAYAMKQIRWAGHEIAVDWLRDGADQTDDILGVLAADIVVALCPLTPGCLVEIGAALASLTPVLLVGDWDHWFAAHPCFQARASSIDGAVQMLGMFDV